MAIYIITNGVTLTQRSEFIATDTVTNDGHPADLGIDKDSTPPSGAYVGANDRITYTLTITNAGMARPTTS